MELSRAAAKHVSRVGENVGSVVEVLSTVECSTLESLCLYGNVLTHCVGLAALTALTELNLSANNITTLHGFDTLPSLRTLNLASNRLRDLEGFPQLPKLTRLSFAHNSISNLQSLSALASAGSPLERLDLRNNRIDKLTELAVLSPLSSLAHLQLSGGSHPNGVAALPGLTAAVSTALPQVRSCSKAKEKTS